MTYKSVLTILIGALALLLCGGNEASMAGERTVITQDGKKRIYRKSPTRVYGYASRRGGYSYSPSDVINTYGLTRNKYGSVNSYRDPSVDRQTNSGPFDHGFFFDSGMGPRGGDSPYLH